MLFRLLLIALFLVMPATTNQPAGFESQDPQLPDCSVVLQQASTSTERAPELVLLSTLDGKVTAVDPSGGILWQLDTGPPLLSTSPKTLFLENSRGETATCIPSLDGSLYVFDGQNIQLFVTAELLLRNSLKTGQSVLTGGTDIKTFGLDPRTGEIRYICSADGGCTNLTDSDGKVTTPNDDDDVVVIRRHTQTVRAIEPRSGKERWHFSVAENELQYVPEASTCGRKPLRAEKNASKDSEMVRILASKGIVTSFKRDSSDINWTIQLKSPVVGAWKLDNSLLREIDLFEPANIIGMEANGPKPFLHLGIFQQQLYMHQNRKLGPQEPPAIDTDVRLMLEHSMSHSSQNALAPLSEGSSTELIPQMLQTLYDDQDHDTGIYFVQDEVEDCTPQLLLPAPQKQHQIDEIDTMAADNISNEDIEVNPEESADDAPIIYVVYSIWHYWKEICAISIVCSVAVNVFLSKLLAMFGIQTPTLIPSAPSTPAISEGTISSLQSSSKTVTANTDDFIMNKASDSISELKAQENQYISRFTTDFEPVRCLGKGGFGIVFESRNRIDDCSYAIKRIRLPSKQAAREKVLREVKALAKLDHPQIVRYYNAWLETPPPGWQEALDETWRSSLPLSSTNALSNEIGTVATVATESSVAPVDPLRQVAINPLKPFDDFFDDHTTNGYRELTKGNGSASGSWCNDDEEDGSEDWSGGIPCTTTDREDSIIFQSSSGDNSVVFESKKCKGDDVSRKSSMRKDELLKVENANTALAIRKRPSCLQLAEASSTQPVYLYIQMQLCRKESLKEWLACRASLDDRGHDKILDIFFQITSAVEYVHDCGLIHRDLKPSNIFFATADDVVKVGDFGLVTGTDTNSTSIYTPGGVNETELSFDGNFNDVQLTDKVGTQLYMSPEQVNGNKYNQKVDIFSLGLIFFELIWSLPTQMERVNTITAVKQLHFPKAFKKRFSTEYQLVRQMVAADPSARPSASEVRKNSLFNEFRQELPIVGRRRTTSTRTSFGSQDSAPSA